MKTFRCTNCLNLSTRPRITFDERGWCNACQWSEEKKDIDWGKRKQELYSLLEGSKNSNGFYDCMVPVSGGKDGSYVSYQLKHNMNLSPLAVTVRPSLEMDLGKKNLDGFVNSGFDHIHISPSQEAMRQLNKYGFIEKGFPYYGFLIGIHTAVLRMAVNLGIDLLFYGEDGEVEYGGSTETKNIATYDTTYQRKIYLEDGYEKVLNKLDVEESDLYFFTFPSEDSLKDIRLTHWSYYEPWDPYRNYLIAKEHCGLQENLDSNQGTFTNFAQNDQYLYALHTYLMYLKFGFGRATQDAGIEIRRGAMTREQGLNLVKLYDAYYPDEFTEFYLDYYQITESEFSDVIDKWANKDLFVKKNKGWILKEEIS
jgi:N-acetyl sugar amidotransferase